MHLLSRIAPHKRQAGKARLTKRGNAKDADDRAFYYWRLLVKQRVYKKNRDLLAQLDLFERIEKVDQTVSEVAGDYERLLRAMAAAKKGSSNGTPVRGRRKRNVIDDDGDDEEEEEEEEEDGAGRGKDSQASVTEGGYERPPKRRRETEA